jgi:hypothetical protein
MVQSFRRNGARKYGSIEGLRGAEWFGTRLALRPDQFGPRLLKGHVTATVLFSGTILELFNTIGDYIETNSPIQP